MEVIGFIIVVVIVGLILYWAAIVGLFALLTLYLICPIFLGIVGSIALWMNGYDNASVIFFIVCCIAYKPLADMTENFVDKFLPKSGSLDHDYRPPSSISGKIAHYDTNGNLTGYSDKK